MYLSTDQIVSDENVIIVALSQDHKPLELFQDPNNEECNYPTFNFGKILISRYYSMGVNAYKTSFP
jgi:hypothetical protein